MKGTLPETSLLDVRMQHLLRDNMDLMQSMQSRLSDINRQVSSIDTRLTIAKQNKNKNQGEIAVKRNNLKQVCGDTEFTVKLEQVECALNKQKHEQTALTSGAAFMQMIVNTFVFVFLYPVKHSLVTHANDHLRINTTELNSTTKFTATNCSGKVDATNCLKTLR